MKNENEQYEKFIGDNMKELLLASFGSMFEILLDTLEDSETEEEFKLSCAKTILKIHIMKLVDPLDLTKLEEDVTSKTTGTFSLLADIMLSIMKNEKMPEETWKQTYENLFK